jgi:hypothetical protein
MCTFQPNQPNHAPRRTVALRSRSKSMRLVAAVAELGSLGAPRYGPILIIICAVAGLAGCTRDERTVTAAQQVLSEHFDAIRIGDTNALLARYSPELFREPKRSREQQVASLARLHAQGWHAVTIVHRELRESSNGTSMRFSCRSRYGSASFEEDFELYRADGTTNFVIIRHDFD